MITKDNIMKLYTDRIKKNRERLLHIDKQMAEQYMLGATDLLNVILDEIEKGEPMKDTIYRQAAIDALLRNQEVYSNNFGNDPIDKYTIAIIDNDAQTIAQLPSAQPEIIRCKDCKHRPIKQGNSVDAPTGDDGWYDYICPCLCEDCYYNWMPEDDFFCKRGERRE